MWEEDIDNYSTEGNSSVWCPTSKWAAVTRWGSICNGWNAGPFVLITEWEWYSLSFPVYDAKMHAFWVHCHEWSVSAALHPSTQLNLSFRLSGSFNPHKPPAMEHLCMFPKTSSPSCSVLSSFVGRDHVCWEEGVCMRERRREGEGKRDRDRESHLSANTSLTEGYIFSLQRIFWNIFS